MMKASDNCFDPKYGLKHFRRSSISLKQFIIVMIIIIINVIIKEENTKNMEIKIMIPRIPCRTHD